MRDDVISGYGRGQYQASRLPGIVIAAAWAIVLLSGPTFLLMLFALGDRLSRALR